MPPLISKGIVAAFLFFMEVEMALYSIQKAEALINEYIPDEKYKKILIMKMCQNMSYETIGEAAGFSPSWVKQIVNRYRPDIMSML